MSQIQITKWTKDQTEQYVAQRFCKYLGSGYGLQKRESPDFLLYKENIEIGLELVCIRDPNMQDIGLIQHDEFASWIGPQWAKNDDVHHWLLSFEYRIEPSFKPNGLGRYSVPQQCKRQGVYQELQRAVTYFERGDVDTMAVMRFEKDYPRGYRSPRKEVGLYLAPIGVYPMLEDHFKAIRFYGGGQAIFAYPGTSLSYGTVGIDPVILLKVFRKKLANKLPIYRNNLPNVPIWLLLYNEGDQGTRLIYEECDIPRYKSIITQSSHSSVDHFEAVWWGTDMMVEGSTPPSFYRLA